jgi:hypothetical protein
MSATKMTLLLQSDICRKAVSRVLACVALVALLALQASMVWHAPEHALNASNRVTEAATSLNAATVKAATAETSATAQKRVTAEEMAYALSAEVASQPEQVSPASVLCLKCLEDVTHSVGLASQSVQLAVSCNDALQPRSHSVCCFATPVALANQRGPPSFLS